MSAGIGYFTLPFLVYGHARHVYACEWNPDSLEALRRNLLANHIDAERYSLLLGDNQQVSGQAVSPRLEVPSLDVSGGRGRSLQSRFDSFV